MVDLLKKPIFKDETSAREWLEARVWAKGRVWMGEDGGAVEIDENLFGRVKGVKIKRGGSRRKNAVLSLLDRKTGAASIFQMQMLPRSRRL